MARLTLQPDTEATRKMVRDHAADFMQYGGDHKKVIRDMVRHATTKAERRARKGAR